MTNMMVRRHVVAAAAAILMGPLLAGCSAKPETVPADAAPPIAVTTALVVMTDMASAIESGGVVQARTTATITARLLAPVQEVRVSPGDHVVAGQTLIVLVGKDLAAGARAARATAVVATQGSTAAAAERQSAEASLALARATHDRVAGLLAKHSATAQELDDATAALKGAEAHVAAATARALQAEAAIAAANAASDQANATESFTVITAPFAGVVTEKMIEPGNMASPGAALLRLEDTRGFRLEVHVDESRVRDIRNGITVPVILDAAARGATTSITGTVVEVSRAVDADARAFLVKLALPDVPGLQSGVFGKARFAGTLRRALVVPRDAIVRRGQITSVFVVDQGIARVRLVNLSDNEVLAGLTESETVVVSPPTNLTDGNRVRVGGH